MNVYVRRLNFSEFKLSGRVKSNFWWSWLEPINRIFPLRVTLIYLDMFSLNKRGLVFCQLFCVIRVTLNCFFKPLVHIRHVLFGEFKQGNCAKETAENICVIYDEWLIITDRAVRSWFIKFCSRDTTLKGDVLPILTITF